tara:strand:- start:63772 stop:64200 length:429 start_codon:yes stop_codon:yes gene_type:complete
MNQFFMYLHAMRLITFRVRIVCLVFLCNCSIGINGFAQDLELNDSLKNYYRLANLAELEVLDSNYKNASAYYSKAFSFKKHPFCSDHYNKALCDVLINDYQNAYKSLKYIVQYGYSLDSLKKIETFKPYFSKAYGVKLIAFN